MLHDTGEPVLAKPEETRGAANELRSGNLNCSQAPPAKYSTCAAQLRAAKRVGVRMRRMRRCTNRIVHQGPQAKHTEVPVKVGPAASTAATVVKVAAPGIGNSLPELSVGPEQGAHAAQGKKLTSCRRRPAQGSG